MEWNVNYSDAFISFNSTEYSFVLKIHKYSRDEGDRFAAKISAIDGFLENNLLVY